MTSSEDESGSPLVDYVSQSFVLFQRRRALDSALEPHGVFADIKETPGTWAWGSWKLSRSPSRDAASGLPVHFLYDQRWVNA